jgi:hypothetical protein
MPPPIQVILVAYSPEWPQTAASHTECLRVLRSSLAITSCRKSKHHITKTKAAWKTSMLSNFATKKRAMKVLRRIGIVSLIIFFRRPLVMESREKLVKAQRARLAYRDAEASSEYNG